MHDTWWTRGEFAAPAPRHPGDSRTPPAHAFDIDVERRRDHTVVAHVFGAIDLLTAPELQVCLDDHVGAVSGLVLDLSRVDFLAASGLTVLTDTDRRATADNFAWALVANTRPVLRPLDVLGLREQFPTYDSVPGAVAAVTA